jgi:hypothetical protein
VVFKTFVVLHTSMGLDLKKCTPSDSYYLLPTWMYLDTEIWAGGSSSVYRGIVNIVVFLEY